MSVLKNRLPFIIASIALCIIPFEEALTLSVGSVLRILNLSVIFLSVVYMFIKKVSLVIPVYIGWLILFICYA